MSLPKFELVQPKTLTEAISFLKEKGSETQLMAGGTDLLVRMKQRLERPSYLLDLKNIPGLDSIAENEAGGLTIGALASLNSVAHFPVIRQRFPALADATHHVAASQLRNRATIGGNVCLESRCWYYNQAYTWRLSRPFCFKMGGDCCHVVKRGEECYSLFCADTPPVLVALGARVKVNSSDGEQLLPLKEIYTGDGKEITTLSRAQVISEIEIPRPPAKSGMAYVRFAVRSALDFPMVGVAAYLKLGEDDLCEEAKIVFTGVVSGPAEAGQSAASMVGHELSLATIADAAGEVVKEIKLFANIGCTVGYRRKLMPTVAAQALSLAWERARGEPTKG
ncbi:MAG: FAD binding domain-containing protein [Thermodesulfobacteriota bacterium]